MGQQPASCCSSNSLAFLFQCLTWQAGRGAIMSFNKINWIAEHPRRADQSAVCAINRHLQVSGFIYESSLLRPKGRIDSDASCSTNDGSIERFALSAERHLSLQVHGYSSRTNFLARSLSPRACREPESRQRAARLCPPSPEQTCPAHRLRPTL